jgi:hypothetical protein
MSLAGTSGAILERGETREAGRMCPFDYRYDAGVFDRAPDFAAETLYVVGGLYGNLAALAAVERLRLAEAGPVTVVFNGDFHWFDAEPDWFAEVERGVAPHLALRGNVETELARAGDVGAGCGCAYPAAVDEDVVSRSNDILGQLRSVARTAPAACTRLRALPMHLVAAVGQLRIGIVHGDAASLAGWRFAHDALDLPTARAWLAEVKAAAGIDLFASTHTCLAALRDFTFPNGNLTVINNGAAGMPNFSASRFGLLSRISTRPSPAPPLYGLCRDGVHIDAIALDYDARAFDDRFLCRWGEGSPARLSYYLRISAGPDYTVAQACPHRLA